MGAVKPGTGARAPIDIRSLARSHGPEAIATLAGLMQNTPKPADRISAAVALLDRGYGRPRTDEDGAEHLNITIRKILEGGAITVVETKKTNDAEPLTIEHDDEKNNTSDTP